MMEALPKRSQLARLSEPDAFWWATGIEDTFITEPWHLTGRTLDEYELTGHYERWREDIGLVAELGVGAARYGVPWHRIQPARDRWDWDFADRTLGRLLELGVEPIVDLVHYGLPPWIEGAYCNPDYPELVADYAGRLAERFQGRIFWYTPLNEPRVTAWYCGRLGWWPPFLRGWPGFVAVMLASAAASCAPSKLCARSIPRSWRCMSTRPICYDTVDPALEDETRAAAGDRVPGARSRQRAGRGRGMRCAVGCCEQGATEADLAWFREHAVDLPVIGMNLYPMFTQKRVLRDAAGRLRVRMPYASADLVTRLGRLYHERYGVPLFISETASLGSVARRRAWLDDSVAASRACASDGIPLVGYTWWPMFALVAWAYRQGRRPPSALSRPDGAVGPRSGSRRRPRTGAHPPRRSLPRSGRRRRGSCGPLSKAEPGFAAAG